MINKRAERGESALMVAIGKERLRCVQVLLERGADTDIPNYEKETPLYKGETHKTFCPNWLQLASHAHSIRLFFSSDSL